MFIIRGTGRRRWRVGEKLQMRQYRPHPDLLQVDPFEVIIDEELEPGDILYIPPIRMKLPSALENAMNYSVGFARPIRELISGFADYVLQRELGNTYYSDPDMPSRKHPADIPPQEMDKLRNMMPDLINEPAFPTVALASFSQSRHELDIAPPEPPYQPDEIYDALKQGEVLVRLGGLRVLGVMAMRSAQWRKIDLRIAPRPGRRSRQSYAPTAENFGDAPEDPSFLAMLAALVSAGTGSSKDKNSRNAR